MYNTFAAEQVTQVLANAGNRVVLCEEQFAPRLLEITGGTAVEHVVCVDGQPAGLASATPPGCTVHILPAVAGG